MSCEQVIIKICVLVLELKDDVMSYDYKHQQLVTLLDALSPYEESDKRNMDFAFSALADEIRQCHHSSSNVVMPNTLLQFMRFQQYHAGIEFFERLQKAQQLNHRRTVLVYFICLRLGLRGRYLIEGEPLLNKRINSLHQYLLTQGKHNIKKSLLPRWLNRSLNTLLKRFGIYAFFWLLLLIIINGLHQLVLLVSL